MDKIPKAWAFSHLSELVVNGGICTDGDWVESKDQDPDGEIRLIQLADIGDGIFSNKSSRFLNKHSGDMLNVTRLKADDILVARMPKPLGRACLFPKVNYAACTVVDILIFRSGSESISQKCLMYFINSPQVRGRMELLSSGSTRKRISGKHLKELSLPIPPEKEQNRIANKIDTLLSHSRKAKKLLDTTPKLAELYRASVFKKYMLGGFDNLHEIKNPAVISIGRPSTKLRDGWVWTKLLDVAKLESGHTPRKSNPLFWNKGDIPWISLKDIRSADQKTIFDTSLYPNQTGIDSSSARVLPKGTVVLSRDISVGYVTIMGREMATSQHFANWVCGPKINNYYLQYALTSSRDYLLNSGQGTTVKTIYMPALKEFYIALPSLENQLEIVQTIQDKFLRIDEIQTFSKVCDAQVSQLDRSILSKAYRGKLVHQDPHEEPASELLKRIKRKRKQMESEPEFQKSVVQKSNLRKKSEMVIPILEALRKSQEPLSSQQLLSAAGYPNNADTDQIEKFFLEIRQAMNDKQVEMWREDNQDYFRLVG